MVKKIKSWRDKIESLFKNKKNWIEKKRMEINISLSPIMLAFDYLSIPSSHGMHVFFSPPLLRISEQNNEG